ncbi:MAG: hypothetical protein K8S55_01575 [Phycisphaerae bacterium]|nr:hypothetical protein [Phycisphaerae bacterium]
MTIDRKEIAAMLVYISEWCIEHRLGSGIIHDTPDGDSEVEDSIFVNGNFARVLICTYEITGEESYLAEAISWCDSFIDVANPVKTSKGNDAVWWWDTGTKNMYFADTGTALHALFKVFPYVDDDRKRKYLDALEKFYLLITEGTDRDPMDRGQDPSPGWVITDGEDAGAFGVGYRHGRLETRTYTISTAIAGAQTCAALYKLTGKAAYRKTALDAARWVLKEFDGKNIPYRIDGEVVEEYVFQPLHYSLEGLLTSWLYLGDDEYREKLIMLAPKIREFVLSVQNEHGYWGTERLYDGQRSAFLAHFLHWYCENIEADPQAEAGAARFAEYVLNPDNTARYGIPNLIRVSGFVGLVFASYLSPELDIKHPEKPIPLCNYPPNDLKSIARKWK